jgi:hypothetical protein
VELEPELDGAGAGDELDDGSVGAGLGELELDGGSVGGWLADVDGAGVGADELPEPPPEGAVLDGPVLGALTLLVLLVLRGVAAGSGTPRGAPGSTGGSVGRYFARPCFPSMLVGSTGTVMPTPLA